MTLQYGVPHSLGGLRGAYIGEHNRPPTEQEIWDAAIRSWRDLNPEKTVSHDRIHQIILENGTTGVKQSWFQRGEVLNIIKQLLRETSTKIVDASTETKNVQLGTDHQP